MKVKKGEFIVHSVVDDGMIRVEYKDRVIQMYPHREEICCFVMTENGNDDKEFFCLYEAMKYIDKVTK